MNEKDYYDHLRCITCRGALTVSDDTKTYERFPKVDGTLVCPACTMTWPLVDGIPVMFEDRQRIFVLLGDDTYQKQIDTAREKMRDAAGRAHDELERSIDPGDLQDALGWEILFWELWKEEGDIGFMAPDRKKIEDFLRSDLQGGGRLQYLARLLEREGEISGKKVVNIGAGRDFLLERFLDHGAEVVEVDVVLEPLQLLKRRGARFCVCCDARKMPFADDLFDLATSYEVLHHVYPIKEPIAELLRVTRGALYILEPNAWSFVRIARLLPSPIQRRLKRFNSGGYSHSPYEKSINPRAFKIAIAQCNALIEGFTYPRSSWIAARSTGIKRILRTIDLAVQTLAPFLSSHYFAMVRKP